MLTLLAVVHVMIGLSLVLFVLLQDPKGGAMGVFSGGSSANTFFGSSGASNFLTTVTKWLAILFAASCLTLTYLTAKQGTSVMDNATPAAAVPAANPPPTPTGVPVQQQPTGTNGGVQAPTAPEANQKPVDPTKH